MQDYLDGPSSLGPSFGQIVLQSNAIHGPEGVRGMRKPTGTRPSSATAALRGTTLRATANWVAVALIAALLAVLPTSPATANAPISDGQTRQTENSGCPKNSAGDPVNTATGEFWEERVDFQLPGIGISCAFVRRYNSKDLTVGPFGPGWTHSFAARAIPQPNGDVLVRNAWAQELLFTHQADGTYSPPPGEESRLLAVSGGFDFVLQNQDRLHFDASGRLLSERDLRGQGLSFTYDAGGRLTGITDSLGRVFVLTYDASNLITQIQLPDDRVILYRYQSGRLQRVTDPAGNATTYRYDAAGRLQRIVDPNGHVMVTNTYRTGPNQPIGRVVEQVDGLGRRTTFQYNDFGGGFTTTVVTDPLGNRTRFKFEANNLMQVVDPLGNATSYEYDDKGLLTRVVDPRGTETFLAYDAHRNLVSRRTPALAIGDAYTYDRFNDVTSHTDARGNTTHFTYDGVGNLIKVKAPDDSATTYAYDSRGRVTSIVDPRGNEAGADPDDFRTLFAYDQAGPLTAGPTTVTTPLGRAVTFAYDTAGRLTSTVDPPGNEPGADPNQFRTRYVYDGDDRLVQSTDPLGNVTRMAYDGVSDLVRVEDANGHNTTYGYDAGNQLTTVTAPDSSTTSYAYDAGGNLVSRTDANAHVSMYGYDAAHRMTSATSPLGHVWQLGYDGNGNLTSKIDPVGATSTYTYDVLNRATGVSYSDGTPSVSYAYDEVGNRTAMTDGAGEVDYTYDSVNRLTGVQRGTQAFAYTYDPASRILTRTFPDGSSATASWDHDGHMASVSTSAGTTTFAYDAAGQLESTAYPAGNGCVEEATRDRAGRVTRLRSTCADGDLTDHRYVLDPVGNPLQDITPTRTTTFAYDALDRLTCATFTASCANPVDVVKYTYDSVGNRLTEERPAGTSTSSYDADDRVTSTVGPSGTTSYGHDAAGRQTSAGGRTFDWNAADELTSTTGAATTTTYSYDGDAVRLSASTGSSAAQIARYAWDVNAPLPVLATESDGAGTELRRYTYGPGILPVAVTTAGSATSYYHHDRMGSVVALTSATGVAQWRYAYEPFGAVTPTQLSPDAPSNPIRFTGQYLDQTGLYHLRARQYDPSMGRFLTNDPLPPWITDPYVSTHAYAGNRPTALTDPSGATTKITITDSAGSEINIQADPSEVAIKNCPLAKITITKPKEAPAAPSNSTPTPTPTPTLFGAIFDGAVSGAISGSIGGAITGSFAGGVGALPGAGIGAVGGGVGGAIGGAFNYFHLGDRIGNWIGSKPFADGAELMQTYPIN